MDLILAVLVLLAILLAHVLELIPDEFYRLFKPKTDPTEFKTPKFRPNKKWVIYTPAGEGEVDKVAKDRVLLKGETAWRKGYIWGQTLIPFRGAQDFFEDTKILVSNIGLDRKIYADFYHPILQTSWLQLQQSTQVNRILQSEVLALEEDLRKKPASQQFEERVRELKDVVESVKSLAAFQNPKAQKNMQQLEGNK